MMKTWDLFTTVQIDETIVESTTDADDGDEVRLVKCPVSCSIRRLYKQTGVPEAQREPGDKGKDTARCILEG